MPARSRMREGIGGMPAHGSRLTPLPYKGRQSVSSSVGVPVWLSPSGQRLTFRSGARIVLPVLVTPSKDSSMPSFLRGLFAACCVLALSISLGIPSAHQAAAADDEEQESTTATEIREHYTKHE